MLERVIQGIGDESASEREQQLQRLWVGEMEQGPMVLARHVLSLSFVCGKTLAKG